MKRLLLVLCVALLLVGSVSAFEFDNVKSYDEATKTVTVKNAFGLGDKIAEVKLVTPLVNRVPRGYQKVAEFIVTSYGEYNNALKELELFDKKKGMNKFTRDYDYKYLTYEDVVVNDYGKVCVDDTNSINNSKICSSEIIGTHIEQKEKWIKLTPADLKKNDILTIGIFTDVQKGDNVEWIPNMFGVRVNEWAVWTEDLNVGLQGYWTLNETSGEAMDSVYGLRNFTISSASSSIGKIGTSLNVTADNGLNDGVGSGMAGTSGNTITVTAWIYRTGAVTYPAIVGKTIDGALNSPEWTFQAGRNTCTNCIAWEGAGGGGTKTGNVIPQDTWVFVGVSISGGSGTFYINGTSAGTFTGSSWTDDAGRLQIGTMPGLNRLTGSIDEVAIWNRSLNSSEMLDLYNSGTGITYQKTFTTPPTITLNTPINYFNTSSSSVTFNWSVTDNVQVDNSTLYIDGVLNQTFAGGSATEYEQVTKTLIDGLHNWTIIAYDDEATEGITSTRFFRVDATAPSVSIITPTGDITDGLVTSTTKAINLNWTSSDAGIGLQTCWFYNISSGLNTTITCGTNVTLTLSYGSSYTFRVYANDSLGNVGTDSQVVNLTYNLLENSLTYSSPVTEGQSTTFSLNLSADGLQSVTANLNYAGTEYPATKVGNNNEMVFSRTISPTLGTNGFFFNISYGGTYYKSSNYTQVVADLNLSECLGAKTVIFNYTIVDEETQVGPLANATIEIDLNILYPNMSIFKTLSANKTTSNYAVCVESDSLNNVPFYVDSVVKYNADPYEPEFYYVQNYSLTNITANQNITLYDLKTADSQLFELVVKDSSFLPVEDALIEVKRKYISEGVDKIVELPKTDASGETVAHLLIDEAIYTFRIIKYGQTIATYDNVRAVCATPAISACTIDFTSFASSIPVTNYETEGDFNFTLGYDSATRTVSSTYLIPSGTSSTIILNVTRNDILGTAVCTDTSTSTSDTLSCVVPASFGNSTIKAQLYKDGLLVSFGDIKLDQTPSDIYGGILVILGLFVMLTLIGASLSDNPIYTIIIFLLGVIFLFAMNLVANNGFIGATATILWLVVAIIIVIVKAGRRT